MITPKEIHKQAARAYPDFLRSVVTGEPFFPFEIRFGKRIPKGKYRDFATKRDRLLDGATRVIGATMEEDAAGGSQDVATHRRRDDGYVVEVAGHNSRRFGLQGLPVRIYFDSEAGFASFLGHSDEVLRFREAVSHTRDVLPALLPWLERHAPRVTAYLDPWPDLLRVCRYLVDHPRPRLYARELPLRVPTKFVETHEGILRLLLEFLLPNHDVDADASGFAERFGLRFDEPLVRMRVLDPDYSPTAGWPAHDVSMPVSAAAELDLSGCTVVITENKMTFLTLPRLQDGLGLWGGGFKVDVLRGLTWLRACDVVYWGDLDAHGFMILSRLRSFLPDARSVMMDVETYETFCSYTVAGTPVDEIVLPNLTPQEQAVYRSLSRGNLRLEQERIPQSHVSERLIRISSDRSRT